jgi:hypothetical protein
MTARLLEHVFFQGIDSPTGVGFLIIEASRSQTQRTQ